MAEIQKRTKKDGTTTYTLRVCTGELNGKKVRVCKTMTPPPGLTEKKLKKWIDDEASKFEDEARGGKLPLSNMTVAELLDRFMDEYGKQNLKPRTLYDYQLLIPRIKAGLGHLKVKDVTPLHITKFYANLAESNVTKFYANLAESNVRQDSSYTASKALLDALPRGKRQDAIKKSGVSERTFASLCGGSAVSRRTALAVAEAAGIPFSKAFNVHTKNDGKLGGSTQAHYARLLSSAFQRAVYWGVIPANPCDRCEKPKAGTAEIQTLTEDEARKLLKALEEAPPMLSTVVQLALLTGCRRAELAGLRWSDIDLDSGIVAINRNLQVIPGQGATFTTPKTKKSHRFVRIGPDAIQLLKEWQRVQKAQRFQMGDQWAQTVQIEDGKTVRNDMVFTRWNGEPIDPHTFTTQFSDFVKANGLPSVHFHSLRHTCATLLIAGHTPIPEVSHRLGHSQISTTLNIYTDVIESADAKAASDLENIFGRLKEQNQTEEPIKYHA